MTFAATANAVLYVGAEVRFADIDPGTLIIEPDLVAAAVTPRTKAILPVDYAGHPADYEALRGDRRPGPGRAADDHRRRVALARAPRATGGPSGPSPT